MKDDIQETAGPDGTPESRLCDTPEESVGFLARLTFRAFSRNLENRINRHGVTGGQWVFLRVLWDEDGMTQRELSRRAGMRESTTVTALNGMERAGLVRRVASVEDRRRSHVYLTPRGSNLRDTLLALAGEVNQISVTDFSAAEITQLRDMMRRIIQNLRAAEKQAAEKQAAEKQSEKESHTTARQKASVA